MRSCSAIGFLVAAGLLAVVSTRAHDLHDAGPVTRPSAESIARASAEMADAALNLWNALTDAQRAAIGFPFQDDAERHNFHFVPRPRKGLPWSQMTPTQQLLAHALVSSGLSRRGYLKTTTVMSLEEILADIEKGRGPKRDPGLYYFTLFGTPGPKGTWGWRIEGHHVAFNFTIVDGKGISGTPAFLGSNPAEVREGARKGLRVLADEQDLGLKLLGLLNDPQKQKAILSSNAPGKIITGADRKADIGEPKGVAYAELDATQQAALRVLVKVYAYRLRDELAEQDLATIDAAGWDKVYFAWAGTSDSKGGHYYRIHGPTFLVEYDNTQNDANHVHTVWRDLKNDFGEDLLRRHYEKEHAVTK
jgi:hypothetical protein